MSKSIFDASNKLSVTVKTVLNGLTLLAVSLVFSEQVDNAEQASIIEKLFAFSENLVATTPAVPGTLFDPAASAVLSFQVIADDGSVLESVDFTFDGSIPNEQQSAILTKLAAFASEMASAA